MGTERIKDRKVGLGIIMFKDRKAFKVKFEDRKAFKVKFEDRKN